MDYEQLLRVVMDSSLADIFIWLVQIPWWQSIPILCVAGTALVFSWALFMGIIYKG